MVMLSVSTDHISMSLGGKQRKVEETSWKTLLMFVCLRGKPWQINKNRWIDSTGGWVEWVSSWVFRIWTRYFPFLTIDTFVTSDDDELLKQILKIYGRGTGTCFGFGSIRFDSFPLTKRVNSIDQGPQKTRLRASVIFILFICQSLFWGKYWRSCHAQ